MASIRLYVLSSLLFGCLQTSLGQTTLWSEDFSDGTETTSGVASGTPGGTWSVVTTPSGTFQRNNVFGIDGFYANNTVTEGVWETNNFSIGATGMATISITLGTGLAGGSDYVRAYYKVDGGPEVFFAELTGSFVNISQTGTAIVMGSNLQIVVRGMDNSAFGQMVVTEVIVTSVPAVYSIANADWSVGTTWSTTGFTGLSCGCTPTTGQVAVIGGGFAVDISSDVDVGGLNIKDTGTLRYAAANVDLGIVMGLVRVESGGSINRNGQSGAQIDFNADVTNANFQVDAGGSATLQDITLAAGATNTHFLTGGGSLSLSGSVLIGATGSTLTNNLTTAPTITSRVEFQAGITNAEFINNQTLTVPTIYFDNDNCTFTNNSSLVVGTIQVAANSDDGNAITNSSTGSISLGAISAADANLNVLNSGSIVQTGNFTGIVGTANFQNLNGSTWTWSLTPNATLDAQLAAALDCSTNSNIFTYSGGGDQDIVPTTYYHLVLANSGTKSIAAALDVNGDLTIQSGVTLSPGANASDIDGDVSILGTGVFDGTGSVTVGGDWSAVDASSYTEGTRSTTFDGAAQVISNASGTETFNALTFSGSGNKSTSNFLDVNSTLTIAGTAQLNVNNNINLAGNWTVTSTNANPYVEGTHTVTLDGTGAQAISTTQAGGETFYDLSLIGTGVKSHSSVINVLNDLTIGSSGNTQLSSGANLFVGGDWTVNSSSGDPYVQGTNTVTFNGTAGGQILDTNLAAGETFNNLTINNTFATSPQITFNDRVTVTGTLNMTAGIVQTTSTNLLVMNNASSAGIGSASSYINGPMQFNMAVNGVTRTLNFPIGKGGSYGGAALTIRHSAGTSFSYTAEVISSSASDLGFTLAGTTDRVSNVRYWDIKRGLTSSPLTTSNANITTSGGNGPRLQLYYTSVDGVNEPSTLTLVKSSGNTGTPQSPWLDIGGTASGSPAGNIAMGSASANFTYFSYFTLGNETGGTNPLPVELVSFEAKVNNDAVDLSWATASELNNDYFTVERAINLENFEEIDSVPGNGTTKQMHHYQTIDPNPAYGRTYYRLKQTDFDGKFTYSEVRVVDYEGPRFPSLKVYPNPSQGHSLTVVITGLKEQSTVPLKIYNLQGQLVYESVLGVNIPGTLKRDIEFVNALKAGVYFVKSGPTLQLTQKIFIH